MIHGFRKAQIEENIARYLSQLDSADRQERSEAMSARIDHLKEKIAGLKQEMLRLAALDAQMMASPDHQISLTDPDARSMATSGRGSGMVGYNVQVAVETGRHLDQSVRQYRPDTSAPSSCAATPRQTAQASVRDRLASPRSLIGPQ